MDATLGMRTGGRPPLIAVPPLATAGSRAGTSASCCSRSGAYGPPSPKALGLSPGCCKLLAHLQRGLAACGCFFNPLEPKAWTFLVATMADTAFFPSLGSLSLTVGSAHRKGLHPCANMDTSAAWYQALGLGLP